MRGAPVRKTSSDRRKKRRKGQERRKGGKRPKAEDRRTGWDRRAATDRRKRDQPGAFSREAEADIRTWVALPAGKRKIIRDCPDCQGAGSIRLRKPIQWAGGKTVQEVRCGECGCYLVIKLTK